MENGVDPDQKARWLHKKPSDLDLNCFLKRIIQCQENKHLYDQPMNFPFRVHI